GRRDAGPPGGDAPRPGGAANPFQPQGHLFEGGGFRPGGAGAGAAAAARPGRPVPAPRPGGVPGPDRPAGRRHRPPGRLPGRRPRGPRRLCGPPGPDRGPGRTRPLELSRRKAVSKPLDVGSSSATQKTRNTPVNDLLAEIADLKARRRATILAHYY